MKLSKILKLIIYLYPPLIIFLLHLHIVIPLNLYGTYEWFDILMHFIGGASIALSSILILNKCRDEIRIKDKLVNIVIIIALVGLSAIFWEFSEFLLGLDIKIRDTLFDILMGLSGGLIIALLFGNSVTRE